MISRRDFLKAAGAAAALPGLASAAEQTRPNILFILADDQSFDSLGCAGHPILKTPNIDHLAADGVRFENAFVQVAICMVSRANILTGMSGRAACVLEKPPQARPEALRTIYPIELHKAGYRTGYAGKWHVRAEGFNPAGAFDVYHEIFRNPYFKEQPDGSLRHTADLIGDRAVEFLSSQPKDQPFCLSLGFNIGHAEDGDKRPGIGHYPWPPAMDGMYDDITIPPPRLNDPAIYENHPQFLKDSINRARYFWRWDTPEKYQINMRAYFRMLSGMDNVIGRILGVLEQQGFADNTIVVYTADNGYYMGDRGFAGKWSHYEQALRVPMIVHDPRLPEKKRGRVADQMVLNLDLPSTFLDWAGVPAPACYEGHSIAPIVDGNPPATWREEFFVEHLQLPPTLTWEGIHGKRYVYARYYDQDPAYEFLHDLEADPDELVNLAGDPEYKAILEAMRKRCDEAVATHGGPMPPLEVRTPKKAPAKKK